MLRAALALVVAAALAAPSYAGCEGEILRSNLGKRATYPNPRDLAKRARQNEFITRSAGILGARWVRYRFRIQVVPSDAAWSLVIRNNLGQVLEGYGPGSVSLDATGSAWTGRLPTEFGIKFDTWPHTPDGTIEIAEYVAMIEPAGERAYYSTAVEGVERWHPLESVDLSDQSRDWMRLGDNVALVMPSWEFENRGCSGFAITSDLLITNWHCGSVADLPDSEAWNEQICRATMIDFSFDGDQRSAEYRCKQVLVTKRSKELDYVLLNIVPVDTARHVQGMRLSAGRREKDSPLAIIHHPAGLRKQLSGQCFIQEEEKTGWQNEEVTRFTHLCDTAPGSSGAPVLAAGEGQEPLVIGLHHYGVGRDSNTCKENETPRRNKAIWIGEIVADLLANRTVIEAKLGHVMTLDIRD